MGVLTVESLGKGRCSLCHDGSGRVVETITEAGEGGSFSSTDLVAGAVATCYMATIERTLVAARMDPAQFRIRVEKTMTEKPKRIGRIWVTLMAPHPLSQELIRRLEKAALLCPVKRSLKEEVETGLSFDWPGR